MLPKFPEERKKRSYLLLFLKYFFIMVIVGFIGVYLYQVSADIDEIGEMLTQQFIKISVLQGRVAHLESLVPSQ